LQAPSFAQGLPKLTLNSGARILVVSNRVKAPNVKLATTKGLSARGSDKLIYAVVDGAGARETAEQQIPVRELAASELDAFFASRPVQSRDVLVYVHGFNNSVESAVGIATDVANKISFGGDLIVFAWPSQASILSYQADIKSAEASVKPLQGLLQMLLANPTIAKVHVLAHSLGNDPAIKAVVLTQPSLPAGPSKLGELILCSPDVGRNEVIQAIGKVTGSVSGTTLWVSNSDIALAFASALGRGVRAGQVPRGEGPIVMSGVVTIDVSRETRLFARNHNAYSQVERIFLDLAELFKPASARAWKNPANRARYIKKDVATGSYWEFVM
jgi:esterase/lipase superfamily enzyme